METLKSTSENMLEFFFVGNSTPLLKFIPYFDNSYLKFSAPGKESGLLSRWSLVDQELETSELCGAVCLWTLHEFWQKYEHLCGIHRSNFQLPHSQIWKPILAAPGSLSALSCSEPFTTQQRDFALYEPDYTWKPQPALY